MRASVCHRGVLALALAGFGVAGCARSIARPDSGDAGDAKSDGGVERGGSGGGGDGGGGDGGGGSAGRGGASGSGDGGASTLNDGGGVAPTDAAVVDGGSPALHDSFDLDLTIATRFGTPVARAVVRIEDRDGKAVQGTADDDGRFSASLDERTAPWDVTVARADFMSVTTILGVTGAIDSPIHLAPAPDSVATSTRTLSGSVSGLGLDAQSVELLGPGVTDTTFSLSDATYTATLADDGSSSRLRILAIEKTSPSAAPSNGAWLDLDLGQAVLAGTDIVFPFPAEARTSRTIAVEMPTDGALDTSGFVMEATSVNLVADEFEYEVGKVGDATLDAGKFECTIDALGGELAPTDVKLTFSGPGGQVFVEVAADASEAVVLPAAEVLASTGTSLADVRLTLRAAEYGHVGASAQLASGRGTWFVYSYGSSAIEDKPWPRLPTGTSFADLDFGASLGKVGKLNTFAITREDGSSPWDWRRAHRERALIRSRAFDLDGR